MLKFQSLLTTHRTMVGGQSGGATAAQVSIQVLTGEHSCIFHLGVCLC